jgi:hypothetical protein
MANNEVIYLHLSGKCGGKTAEIQMGVKDVFLTCQNRAEVY